MILHDQHVHSIYSEDSNEPIRNYIEKAQKLGCEYFITTEHLDLNIHASGYDWKADYRGLSLELKKLQKEYPNIKLLLGVEAGYNKKLLGDVYKIIDSEDFDLVNLSIHDYEDVDFYYYDEFLKRGIDKTFNIYYDHMIDAIETVDNFNVLSHIDYAFKSAYLGNNQLRFSDFEEKIKIVLKKLIEKDKTLEINTKVQEAINDDNHTRYLLRLYKSLGGKNISLSSDAHVLNKYLSSFEHYKNIIKEEGFDHLDYFVKRKRYRYDI